MVQLKIRGSQLTWKVTNKGLDVHERAEVLERNKNGHFDGSDFERKLRYKKGRSLFCFSFLFADIEQVFLVT